MNRQLLTQVTKLAKEARISESIQLLLQETNSKPITYTIACNLAALHLQLGAIQQSLRYSTQAVALDPYLYIAYYNRFLALHSSKAYLSARKELLKALSCLYLYRGLQYREVKNLNKAVSFCEQNARAYLARAKLNESKNKKLAENDYSAAVEYDPGLAQTYQQRALFYRSLNKSAEFERDLAMYLQLKDSKGQSISDLVANDEEPLPQSQILERIQQQVAEFNELLRQKGRGNILTSSGEAVSKLPLSSLQSKMQREEELLLGEYGPQGSAKTITIKKEEIQFRKKPDNQMVKQFREIFQDESSRQLDDKIDRLEREIQRNGGKIPSGNAEPEELDVSDPSNFLTQQIEKAIQEINKLTSPDLADAKSIKSVGSMGSNHSEHKQLTLQEFATFKTITIEVISMEDIQAYNHKELAKIRLTYADQVYETQMKKYEWGETLSFGVVEEITEVEVTVVEKGSVFRADTEIGQGTINLLQKNSSKCIIGNREKKVAILYFKVGLA